MTDLVERLRYCACVEENPTFEIAMKEAATEIERLRNELADHLDNEKLESDHFYRLAVVDPGANPPVLWKEKTEQLAKELAEARELLARAAVAVGIAGVFIERTKP